MDPKLSPTPVAAVRGAPDGEALSAAREWRQGWPTVLACSVGVGTGATLYPYMSSLFLAALSESFNWTRGQVSAAFAIGMVGVLAAVPAGRLVDRCGARRVALTAIAGVGLTYFALALAPGLLWVLTLLFVLLTAIGMGTTALVYTQPVNRHFRAGRGMALGVTMSGVSLFAVLMPIVLKFALDWGGWRYGYLALAVLCMAVGGLTVFVLLDRDRHAAAVGAYPAGATALAKAPQQESTLRDALRSRPFWILLAVVLVTLAPNTGVMTQLQSLVRDKGVAADLASAYVSLFGASVVIGRLVAGSLLDRWRPHIVSAATMTAPAIGVLILNAAMPTPEALAAAVILVGICQGAEVDLIAYFTARYFGMAAYSSVLGVLLLGVAVSSAFGALAFGLVFDRLGSYSHALIASAFLYIAAAALFVWLERHSMVSRLSRITTAE